MRLLGPKLLGEARISNEVCKKYGDVTAFPRSVAAGRRYFRTGRLLTALALEPGNRRKNLATVSDGRNADFPEVVGR
jgi:hypothetical protein